MVITPDDAIITHDDDGSPWGIVSIIWRWLKMPQGLSSS
jgi:hypothetical protein